MLLLKTVVQRLGMWLRAYHVNRRSRGQSPEPMLKKAGRSHACLVRSGLERDPVPYQHEIQESGGKTPKVSLWHTHRPAYAHTHKHTCIMCTKVG